MTSTERLRVLVGCEFSGIVRNAFIERGHDAWSNDLLPAEDGGPHLQTDVHDAIARGSWDIIIMHPPCTALAVSGNRWYGEGMPRNDERRRAIEWTMDLWRTACEAAPRVCMENPVGVLPLKPTQYIQPHEHGHGETKKTGLWLYNLPPLAPSNPVDGREQRVWKMGPSPNRWMDRSRTYTGVAAAMANQWSPRVNGRCGRLSNARAWVQGRSCGLHTRTG